MKIFPSFVCRKPFRIFEQQPLLGNRPVANNVECVAIHVGVSINLCLCSTKALEGLKVQQFYDFQNNFHNTCPLAVGNFHSHFEKVRTQKQCNETKQPLSENRKTVTSLIIVIII